MYNVFIMTKRIKFILTSTVLMSAFATALSASCNKVSNVYDKELKEAYTDWYKSLTNSTWNKDRNGKFIDYHLTSEQQAIGLYSWCGGVFWNEPLHKGIEPTNVSLLIKNDNLDKNRSLEIRGEDYKYIDSALEKATYPRNDVLWHGVEYQEVEFYEQLKDFIIENNGKYNYDNCVGKTIQSKGFISTTLIKKYATEFFGWRPTFADQWNSDIVENNPLKEKVAFKINIQKGYKGAAYLANFDFAGFGEGSEESQVLLKRNCKFKITKVYKEKDVNIFEVDLV
ncbi:hypothetical protein HUN03_00047 [Mycoplasmopsis anatis]|nr:hypothetical protein [Mycoplasmopsis anatis]MBW0595681.1 hypothetical protein [Mycoplasmopsis anatis]MBW0598627.1 hypothetical protein [Mycoplasmopsis anatis]MBW0601515.1 hypothetical protein [Mycoplasmopsis anatis]MBW0602271.1 hypothetical protein [Mycoplasmopsis anatis]